MVFCFLINVCIDHGQDGFSFWTICVLGLMFAYLDNLTVLINVRFRLPYSRGEKKDFPNMILLLKE